MFTSFELKNYRNFREISIEFDRGLNIFVGPNNSGKTNFIEALSFLKDCLDSSFHAACRKRGYTNFVNYCLEFPVDVKFKWVFSLKGFNPLGYELILDVFQEGELPIIKYERLGYEKELPGKYRKSRFDHVEAHKKVPGEGFFSFYSKAKGKMVAKKFPLSNKEIFLNQIDKLDISHDLKTVLIPRSLTVSQEVREFISKWFIYRNANIDIERAKKGGDRDEEAFYLNSEVSNLAQVFFNLQNDQKYYKKLKITIQKLQDIIPELEDIRAVVKGDYVEVFFEFRESRRSLRLAEISDGTVRMLILALILFHPEPPILVIIDEPELNLHPAWLKVLAEWFKEASARTQIIFSTHSPDFLDHFTDFLENVLVFERGDIKRLSRERLRPFLEEGWELGDLYRVGEPAVGGWPW